MKALFYSRTNPDKKNIDLTFDKDKLIVNGEKEYTFKSISFSSSGNSRLIYLHDSNIVEYTENESINEYIQVNKSKKNSDLIKSLRFKLLVILPVTALLCILLYLSFNLLLPSVSKNIVNRIPQELAKEIGDEALISLDETSFQPSKLSKNRQLEIKDYFSKKIFVDDTQVEYSIIFRASETHGANAFALPNGTIVLLDDLVQLSSNNDEIISVIAHEAGHIYHKHAFQKIVQNSILTIGLVLITGDVTSLPMLAGLIPIILIQQSYSREAETEADKFAIEFLKRNGIDSNNFASILTKITESHINHEYNTEEDSVDRNNYFSSHPAIEERIEIINKNNKK